MLYKDSYKKAYVPTPITISYKLCDEALIYEENLVLEPSCGTGELAKVILHNTKNIILIEQNEELAKDCEINLGIHVHCMDFFGYRKRPWFKPVDRVVAAPPFSEGRDIDHIMEMWHCLKEGGRLVSLIRAKVATSMKYRDKVFRQFVKEQKGKFEILSEDWFPESTVVVGYVVINKL